MSIMDKGILSKTVKGVRLGFGSLSPCLYTLRPSFSLDLSWDLSVFMLFVSTAP